MKNLNNSRHLSPSRGDLMHQIINENTPVELYDGVYYKRDDLFQPFGMHGMNGSKVRQAIELIRINYDHIVENCHGTVITHTQVHSTTGTILAQVAKAFGLKCVICVGGCKEETLDRHYMMRLAKHLGAEIRIVCGTGMHGPVLAKLRNIVDDEGFFNAVYSANVDKFSEAIVDLTAEQVENIPDMLINLVVPVGSGIQMAGILRGLTKYEKYVENIYGLCIGPDRRTRIDYFVNPLEYPIPSYNMIELKTKYANLAREFYGGGRLDELYEAKAYRWMVDNLNIENEKTLFWIVGRRLFEDEVLENYDLT